MKRRVQVFLTDEEIERIDNFRGRASRSFAIASLIISQLDFESRKTTGQFASKSPEPQANEPRAIRYDYADDQRRR